jgi:hypothetical protein
VLVHTGMGLREMSSSGSRSDRVFGSLLRCLLSLTVTTVFLISSARLVASSCVGLSQAPANGAVGEVTGTIALGSYVSIQCNTGYYVRGSHRQAEKGTRDDHTAR